METTQIQTQLQDYYRRTFPNHQDARILDVISLTDGWESIIYAFKLAADPKAGIQPKRLILRIYPGTDAVPKSGREFEGLQILYQLNYPVPQVYHLERDHSPFESRPFMLMEWVEGEMLWPVLNAAQPDRLAVLITQFCELFVWLHKLDWQNFVPQQEQAKYKDPFFCMDGYISWIQRELEYFPDLKFFSPVLAWLEERRDLVPCPRPTPVHWDFHPGNVILKSDGDAVVIDWTQIQVSDPRFDLGWTLLLAGAYAGDDVRDMILAEYQRILGRPIEQLAFFEVANCIKRIGSVLISLLAGADQIGMRPEAVESMGHEFPALRWVYELMVDHTGIRLLEVESLISG